jgi:hypothetical protein
MPYGLSRTFTAFLEREELVTQALAKAGSGAGGTQIRVTCLIVHAGKNGHDDRV